MLPLSVGSSRNQTGTACAICTGNFILKEWKDKAVLFEHLTSISKKTFLRLTLAPDDFSSLLAADQKRSSDTIPELKVAVPVRGLGSQP